MKRIVTSALAIILTIGAAQAQITTDKHAGHKKEHNKAFDDLNLSADQKARLQSIHEDFRKQSKELKNNTSLSAEEKKARRKTLHEQFKTQSENVLTPAQKEQLAKKKAEWKEKNKDAKRDGKNGNVRGKGFGRSGDIQKELGLTETQKQKMEQLRTDFRNRLSSVRSDNNLTQEQKKQRTQELMKQQHEEMKSILTPEQIQKLESLRKEHPKNDAK